MFKLHHLGLLLILFAVIIFLYLYSPLLKNEVNYFFTSKFNSNQNTKIQITESNNKIPKTITPVDRNFTIIIPKLNINTKVIKNVNPYDSKEYQVALSKGVAHAITSALPGDNKNIFLFAHSSDNFLNANRYNSIFYLLYKLKPSDSIYLVYNSKIFEYRIGKISYVSANEVSYLESKNTNSETLTLMTCWPPATTFKRLIVTAKYINQ